MGTKQNPGAFDCYANAADDEPMFVLLARDKHAPTLVWLWAVLRELDGENPEKVAEARLCVAEMMAWAKAHNRKVVGIGHAGLAALFELIRCANHAVDVSATNEATAIEHMRLFLCASEFEKPEQ
jgi:hypothetical protein